MVEKAHAVALKVHAWGGGGLPQQRDGLVLATLRVASRGQQIKRVRLGAAAGQGLPITAFGVGQLAGAMIILGLLAHLRGIGHHSLLYDTNRNDSSTRRERFSRATSTEPPSRFER